MRFQYRTLDGRISDARRIRGRFTAEFSVDSTPVQFLGDPSTVLSIAKGRRVILIGRQSVMRASRFVANYLTVPDTGVTIRPSIVAPTFSLIVAAAGLVWAALSGDRALLVLLPICAVGLPASALLAYDAYRSRAVATSAGLGSNNRWRGP